MTLLKRIAGLVFAGCLLSAATLNAEGLEDKMVVPPSQQTAPGGSTYVAPGGSTYVVPGGSTTVAPGGSTYIAPGGSTYVAPGSSTTVTPGGSTYVAPGSSTTVAPGGSTYVAPGGSTTVAPGGSTYVAPGSSTTVAPGGSTTVAPGGSTTVAPGNSTTIAPGGSTYVAPPSIPVVPIPPAGQAPEGAQKTPNGTPAFMTPGQFIPLTPLTPDGKIDPKGKPPQAQAAGGGEGAGKGGGQGGGEGGGQGGGQGGGKGGGKGGGEGAGQGGGKGGGEGAGQGGGKGGGQGAGQGGGQGGGEGGGQGGGQGGGKGGAPSKPGKPKKGDPLRIPPEAAKSGDLSFLEGCWRGTRPEYGTKRIITERFCFDANGSGKRHIIDPTVAGECYGATRGQWTAGGKLSVTSENGYCTSGHSWSPAEMICQGEGNQTPCSWKFAGDPNQTQSYKIPFVRE